MDERGVYRLLRSQLKFSDRFKFNGRVASVRGPPVNKPFVLIYDAPMRYCLLASTAMCNEEILLNRFLSHVDCLLRLERPFSGMKILCKCNSYSCTHFPFRCCVIPSPALCGRHCRLPVLSRMNCSVSIKISFWLIFLSFGGYL